MASRKPLTFRGTLRGINSPAVRPAEPENGARTVVYMPEPGARYAEKNPPDLKRTDEARPIAETPRRAARPIPPMPDAQPEFIPEHINFVQEVIAQPEFASDFTPEHIKEFVQEAEAQYAAEVLQENAAEELEPQTQNNGTEPLVELSELIFPKATLEQLCEELLGK